MSPSSWWPCQDVTIKGRSVRTTSGSMSEVSQTCVAVAQQCPEVRSPYWAWMMTRQTGRFSRAALFWASSRDEAQSGDIWRGRLLPDGSLCTVQELAAPSGSAPRRCSRQSVENQRKQESDHLIFHIAGIQGVVIKRGSLRRAEAEKTLPNTALINGGLNNVIPLSTANPGSNRLASENF